MRAVFLFMVVEMMYYATYFGISKLHEVLMIPSLGGISAEVGFMEGS